MDYDASIGDNLPGVAWELQDDGARTALHWAVAMGHANTVAALLQAGADVTARTAFGRSPLDLAVAADDTTIADLLRTAGAVE